MICIEHTNEGITRKAFVAESILDFLGWSVIEILGYEPKPNLRLVLCCRNMIGGMEIRPVLASSDLAGMLIV